MILTCYAILNTRIEIQTKQNRDNLSSLMGLNPELLWSKEKQNDEIMEINILAFNAKIWYITLIPNK
jgi:hypothetical protein